MCPRNRLGWGGEDHEGRADGMGLAIDGEFGTVHDPEEGGLG